MSGCTEPASVRKVDKGDAYYHVRVRDPDGFSRIRTLDDPESDGRVDAVRDLGVHGLKVGEDDDQRDTWCIQSVLVPTHGNTERSAGRKARRAVTELE